MATAKSRVRQIVQVYDLGGGRTREDALVAPTTDAAAWKWAEEIAERHVAAWLHEFAGQPVPDFEPALAVRIEGLARKNPHPNGSHVWQVRGAALILASGLQDPGAFEVFLSDYRTAEGRIDRKRSASSERARDICRAMEQGEHPREAIASRRLPSVPRIPTPNTSPRHDDDAAALAFYRSLVAADAERERG